MGKLKLTKKGENLVVVLGGLGFIAIILLSGWLEGAL